MPNIGEQVVCPMDENSEYGVILGSIYSSEDTPVVQSEKEISINLEDGSFINANKKTRSFIKEHISSEDDKSEHHFRALCPFCIN